MQFISYISLSKVDEILGLGQGRYRFDLLLFLAKGLLWGIHAAFQVEGTSAPSNWTMWEESVDDKGVPRIKDGQRVGKSCDHLNLYADDIKNMNSDLGCNLIDLVLLGLAWNRKKESLIKMPSIIIEND